MRAATEQAYKQRILKALVYIQQHLSEAISLDELAAVASFSPHHFHRIFGAMVGESVMEHVRRLRLERAGLQLKNTDEPVTRIAFNAGYETHESFTRAFGAMFGESPTQFRQNRRPRAQPESASGIHYDEGAGPADFKARLFGGAAMTVRIENIPAMRVAFMRHTGPYLQVGSTWTKLMSWAGPRGLLGPNCKMIGICHDDPDVTPAEKLRYDACVVVSPQVRAEGEVGVQEIAGGDYAIATHRGPYEGLADAYRRLYGEWLPSSGREPRSSPTFEIYRNSPMDTAPENLLTDIYVPLA
jgi:AraC family transcriptional regulator